MSIYGFGFVRFGFFRFGFTAFGFFRFVYIGFRLAAFQDDRASFQADVDAPGRIQRAIHALITTAFVLSSLFWIMYHGKKKWNAILNLVWEICVSLAEIVKRHQRSLNWKLLDLSQ